MTEKKPIYLKSMQDLYDLAGSSTRIAADLGLHQYTVDRWRISGVPNKYHEPLAKLYGATPYELYKLSQKIRSFRKAA
jgi:hypothetical protein